MWIIILKGKNAIVDEHVFADVAVVFPKQSKISPKSQQHEIRECLFAKKLGRGRRGNLVYQDKTTFYCWKS